MDDKTILIIKKILKKLEKIDRDYKSSQKNKKCV